MREFQTTDKVTPVTIAKDLVGTNEELILTCDVNNGCLDKWKAFDIVPNVEKNDVIVLGEVDELLEGWKLVGALE